MAEQLCYYINTLMPPNLPRPRTAVHSHGRWELPTGVYMGSGVEPDLGSSPSTWYLCEQSLDLISTLKKYFLFPCL